MKNPAQPAPRTISGPTMNRALEEPGLLTSLSGRGCDGLSNHGGELRSLHESDDAKVSPFLAVGAIEGNRRRADDAEVRVQLLVFVVVRGDVGLQQHGVR